MKSKMILGSFVLGAMLASCAAKPGDVTKITGVVNDAEVTAVRITLPEHEIDTTVAVEDGKFYLEVPADVQNYGIIRDAGRRYGTYFISDGTKVQLTFADNKIDVKTEPEYAEAAYAAYVEKISALEPSDKEGFKNICMETVKANPANGVAILVVADAMYALAPNEMLELISCIEEPVRSHDFVVSREKEADAQKSTAEGMMFTDFTVEHVYGYDRSMDPQPLKKEVKFSDYVGKGKYVLVDFWSPWCGPCRREVPNIQKVYNEYKSKGLEVLSIAVWERQPQSHTIQVAGELGMDWAHINNAGSIPTQIYGIGGIPHLMLIGPDGTILKRGFHGLEGIEAAVSEYLN